MAKEDLVKHTRIRKAVQGVWGLLHNAHLSGFVTGTIYQGPLKKFCVPGMNCYSCPGAVGACPVGSLQNFLGSRPVRLPYYVAGLLLFFGALLGRAVCGFLCPAGWLQELLHRIPFPKKRRGDRAAGPLRKLKYVILALTVVLPLFFALTPFFCKYLCPAGTLAGVFLALSDSAVRPLLGGLFAWKAAVLVSLAAASILLFRPFCKYLCPLGAIYGLFNRFALYRGEVDEGKCIRCEKCAAACRMGVEPHKDINSAECIRCGDCVRACPTAAIRMGFSTAARQKGGEGGNT